VKEPHPNAREIACVYDIKLRIIRVIIKQENQFPREMQLGSILYIPQNRYSRIY